MKHGSNCLNRRRHILRERMGIRIRRATGDVPIFAELLAGSHSCLGMILLATVLGLSPAVAGQPPITAARFTAQGTEIVLGSQGGIEVRSWPQLELLRRIETRLAHVHDLCFISQESQLIAIGGRPAEQGSIERFEWLSGEALSSESAGEDVLYCVTVAANGCIAIGSGDRLVTLLRESGRQSANGITESPPGTGRSAIKLAGHSHAVLAAAFLPDDKTLVTAGIDQTLRVWDTNTGDSLRTLAIHTAPVLGLAPRPGMYASPHPYVASVSEDRSVRLWQPTIGRMVRFARLDRVPLSVDWTADGSRIVVGCDDGVVRVIDPDSVNVVAEYPALEGWVYTVATHPERNEVLAGGTGGMVGRIVLE